MKRPPDVFSPREKPALAIPYDFVLDALAELEPSTRAMFGSTAVYLGERVLFILRKKGDPDDGVWVAFEEDRTADALAALPNLVAIERLPNVRCWRKLAARSTSFEDDALLACRLAGDPEGPLGKIPVRQSRPKRAGVATKKARSPQTAKASSPKVSGEPARAKRAPARATKPARTKR